MTFESRRKSGRPPSTSEYLEALSIIRVYLEFLGCSEKELEALQVLESMHGCSCQKLILSLSIQIQTKTLITFQMSQED